MAATPAMLRDTTIYALSSGAGTAGVAVVRVSGPAAGACLDLLAGGRPEPRRASLRLIRHCYGEPIDRGLVLWLPGPASFTGEDMAEFQVHAGPAVVAALIAALGEIEGCVAAEAGDFTRRAFANGRLDLTAVEGLADLIAARTAAQHRQALHHQLGGAAARFEAWRRALIEARALVEAAIDFGEEEDVAASVLAGLPERIAGLACEIAAALGDAHRGERLRDGVRVVLAGAPNTGKSSLLNALARREAAIVSPVPGTTRDVIEVHLDLAGVPVILSDTAGLRAEPIDPVEREGMARARRRLEEADLVLWVAAPDEPDPPAGVDSDALWIWNKADLAPPPAAMRFIPVSARTGEGVDGLVDLMAESVLKAFGAEEPALVTRERHRQHLARCLENLRAAVDACQAEIVGERLRLACRELERLAGRVDVEDVLDVIFRDFCIGK